MKNIEKSLYRKWIHYSIKEGFYTQISNALGGIGSPYLTAFLIFLGAGNFSLALLVAADPIARLIQIPGAFYLNKQKQRKKFILTSFSLSRLFPVFLIILLYVPNSSSTKITVFMLLFITISILNVFSSTGWFSWVHDFVPRRFRAMFLALRIRAINIASISVGFIFSFLFDAFYGKKNPIVSLEKISPIVDKNFAFLFVFAFSIIAGAFSIFNMSKQPDIKKKRRKINSLSSIFFPLKDRTFRKLLIFFFYWIFSATLASPFWQPFMLKYAKMGLFEIQIYSTISIIIVVFFLKKIGSVINKIGSFKVLKFALILSGINPLFFILVKPGNFFILYLEAISSGIMWTVYNIVSQNIMLNHVEDDKKEIYIGMFSFITGIAAIISILSSPFIMNLLPSLISFGLIPMQGMFILTAILRFSSLIPLNSIKHIKD